MTSGWIAVKQPTNDVVMVNMQEVTHMVHIVEPEWRTSQIHFTSGKHIEVLRDPLLKALGIQSLETING